MPSSGRTFILCLDGTSNEFSHRNTNVIKMFDCLVKDDPRQKVFYQPGIGTYTPSSFLTPITRRVAKLVDLAFAWYLPYHVQSAYTFLIDNYKNSDDRIILIGFSRGAYTCRALAGMIHKVGLIPEDNAELVSFAWDLVRAYFRVIVDPNLITKQYKSNDDVLAANFKAVTSRSVLIDQLLLFDSVSSVGVITARHLPFTSSNNAIRHFTHAMSLGERRVRFAQNPWQRGFEGPERQTPNKPSERLNELLEAQGGGPVEPKKLCADTQVRQLYFLGDHSDVGGGRFGDAEVKNDISSIPLRWMIEEMLINAPDGTVLVDSTKLKSYGIPFPINRESQSTTEGETPWYQEKAIKAPLHDHLSDGSLQMLFWWLLEIFPMKQTYQVAQPIEGRRWSTTWFPHFGKRRTLPDPAYLHNSVKSRLDADPEYKKEKLKHQSLDQNVRFGE